MLGCVLFSSVTEQPVHHRMVQLQQLNVQLVIL